ncbi:lipoprotein [Saccharothrix sp. ST-888]|uniref:lipoprotein n=1 Tax=Saccharothrix sp. ST-888 TaxID=1427391 RepID=UPI0005EC5144|nr:lipoprotein [Saccharothrix sp. ST-888]KJK58168.1 lipoprotein [Saccharothrix sp. ST-888]
MDALSRRTLLAAGAGAAATLAAGCASSGGGYPAAPSGARSGHRPSGTPKPPAPVLIGDGSTADTGPQPHQPTAEPLRPGEHPPQFVVFSWDGAGELDNRLFSRFRDLAKEHSASMTFFLSGLYLLPESKRELYHPPQHPAGASDIGYLNDQHIHDTLEQIGAAWLEGHEIGTHFNGHFCGTTGVANWSPEEWDSEIEQAMDFVMNWKTNTGFTDLPALPFDYRKELIGGRTPCLEGQRGLLPTAAERGWKYDSSGPGGLQIWPQKLAGGALWDFPLQSVPFPGHTFQVLSMDYNIMFNQSGANTKGDSGMYPGWRTQARDSYLAGFERAYTTNRAPFYIGNHFEEWNGGIYMDAVEDAFKVIAQRPDVRLVSFRQLVHWLEAQDPAVLRKLQSLGPGEAPAGGWETLLGTPNAAPAPSAAASS